MIIENRVLILKDWNKVLKVKWSLLSYFFHLYSFKSPTFFLFIINKQGKKVDVFLKEVHEIDILFFSKKRLFPAKVSEHEK
ncbi:hypothetical protein CON84_06420 [Bacillus sp. AFS094228]|nr:hypothetical protein CON84_06420 [Bacillus sp. AFS094228]